MLILIDMGSSAQRGWLVEDVNSDRSRLLAAAVFAQTWNIQTGKIGLEPVFL